jgi:hypothetical protein
MERWPFALSLPSLYLSRKDVRKMGGFAMNKRAFHIIQLFAISTFHTVR